ncbi:LOW QUALITY PROTEIN: uncharacterized protein C2orf78-like [Molossus nigricans]
MTSDLHTGHMHSLAPASATSSSIVSTVDISSSLTMSENFQNPPLLGISKALQLSLPVVNNAAFFAGSVCNFSRVSAAPPSAAWLLSSASDTSSQPLMGGASLYQHASSAVSSGVTGQSQIFTSGASNPGVFEWVLPGGPDQKFLSLGDYTVTVTDQNRAVSFMSMASQYHNTSDANNMAPLYPLLFASLVQGAPSQIPNQGHSLSFPYQEGSKVYYYNQWPLLSGEHGPYLQSYGSVTDTESRVSAPPLEMVMVLQEMPPTNVRPPASTSGTFHSVSAQSITKTSFQEVKTSLGLETSLGLQPPSPTFCLLQTPEFPKTCSSRYIQILETNSPPELGDISMAAPLQSPSNPLALPLPPNQKQKEEKNVEGITTLLAKPLLVQQKAIENQDPPGLIQEILDSPQVLAYIDLFGQEEQPGCEKPCLGKIILSNKDQGTESDDSFVDIATLVENIQLPQVLHSLDDLDQSKGPKVIETKGIRDSKFRGVHKKTSVIKSFSDHAAKNKDEASEPISGAAEANSKPESPDCVSERELVPSHGAATDSAPAIMAKHSNSKPPKATSGRTSKTKSHGPEKTKRNKENTSKKAEESHLSGDKIKSGEKPTILKMKRKKNQPELTQEPFKKPRSCLARHMLESVKVFHPLGKKVDKKMDLSSSRDLGNSSHPKGSQPSPALKRLDTVHEGKRPENTQVKRQKPVVSAENQCSPPSEYQLPPPGKVKLVPLLFPTSDKPAAQPVPHRPQSLASRRPAVPNPARPGSNSAQPTAVSSSRTTPAAMTGPARVARPISTKPDKPVFTNSAQASAPQSAASRPVPYETSSCAPFQREPVRTALTTPWRPPKPLSQNLLQDFAVQRIPWRKPDISGPVMSTPITKEQRPEREAMKRKAQLERENAAKYTSLGKVQYFIEREKEMGISQYYGYAS